MSSALQVSGAQLEPSSFAPLHVNRMLTGLWTNSNPLRDAGSSAMVEKFYGGRQDAIIAGINCEITPKQTLRRRRGLSVYNSGNFPKINRFYSFNTFSLNAEAIHVLADTAQTVYDATPNSTRAIFSKSAGSGPTYFQSVGNTLYFSNGVDNMQWNHDSDFIGRWGITAPAIAPTVLQQARPNNYPSWQPATAYQVSSPALSGILILDDLTNIPSNVSVIPTETGGDVAIMCGQDFTNGAAISLPQGFDNTRLLVWCSPAVAFDGAQTTPGVFSSKGNGGVLQSFFQNRSGGSGFAASTNWVAIAWTANSGVNFYSNGNYNGINFRTQQGDVMWIQVGFGFDQSNIYTPSGISMANSLHLLGMISSENVDHAMQGVWQCNLTNTTINATYNDGQGWIWHGNANVFSVFWTGGGGVTPYSVAHGTSLIIPTGGTNTVAMIFGTMHHTDAHGLPPGYSASQFVETCAMVTYDYMDSGDHRAHGWSCLMQGQTLAATVRDSEGNQWHGNANYFAIGSIVNAVGGNVQFANGTGTTGSTEPGWNQSIGGTTPDGSVTWTNLGPSRWQSNHYYAAGNVVMGVVTSISGTPNQLYVCIQPGVSGAVEPHWPSGVNVQKQDGAVTWQCVGQALSWNDIGAGTQLSAASTILDSQGYLQAVLSPGVSGNNTPQWAIDLGAVTEDHTVVWKNAGPFSPPGAGPVKYGYSYQNSGNQDQSNMSPESPEITVNAGNEVVIQGVGTGQPGVNTINLWRTLQNGSTFMFMDSIPNPGEGQTWTYEDNLPDSALDITMQAPNTGQNTPLPAGATCLEYHVGRIFAAVGNVVWISSGPDATLSGSNGNIGFNISFTCQSSITRLWANSLGLCVFTVRDVYVIQGDGAQNQFTISRWIENMPLLSYDAFTVNLTTAYLLTGQRQVMALDPGGGILEVSFPISDVIARDFPPQTSYLTYHTGVNAEAALYVSNGTTEWLRMSSLNAPDMGQAWNPPAFITGGMSAVQSVEISPGVRMLLVGPSASGGPIRIRDTNVRTDAGTPYEMKAFFGNINLAVPGQLAGITWFTVEGSAAGLMPEVLALFGEIHGTFELIPRTRQDPPNLPPSETIIANRHSVLQSQQPVWCRHLLLGLTWPAEDDESELYAYTIFGQMWQEMRAQ
jgi:hypothetical protein